MSLGSFTLQMIMKDVRILMKDMVGERQLKIIIYSERMVNHWARDLEIILHRFRISICLTVKDLVFMNKIVDTSVQIYIILRMEIKNLTNCIKLLLWLQNLSVLKVLFLVEVTVQEVHFKSKKKEDLANLKLLKLLCQ